MRSGIQRVLVIFVLFSLVLPNQTLGSIVQKLSIREKAEQADAIVYGTVTQVWVSPDPEQRMFFTYMKVRPLKNNYKGKTQREYLLQQPGGIYVEPGTGRKIVQRMFGMESYDVGEKAIFFIKFSRRNGAPVAGFAGKHSIKTDPATGMEMVIEKTNPVGVEYMSSHSGQRFANYDRKSLRQVEAEIMMAVNSNQGDPP